MWRSQQVAKSSQLRNFTTVSEPAGLHDYGQNYIWWFWCIDITIILQVFHEWSTHFKHQLYSSYLSFICVKPKSINRRILNSWLAVFWKALHTHIGPAAGVILLQAGAYFHTKNGQEWVRSDLKLAKLVWTTSYYLHPQTLHFNDIYSPVKIHDCILQGCDAFTLTKCVHRQ